MRREGTLPRTVVALVGHLFRLSFVGLVKMGFKRCMKNGLAGGRNELNMQGGILKRNKYVRKQGLVIIYKTGGTLL